MTLLAERVKHVVEGSGVSLGSWVSMAHVSIAEILATAGYEWVVVDTEHTAIDVSEVLPLIMAIEGRGAVPLVRLAGNDPLQAKAVLDSGAAGVLVPMIMNTREAEEVVAAVKYPPQGRRGVGLARAHDYGPGSCRYVERANGVFGGPYDMSASMGIPAQLDQLRAAGGAGAGRRRHHRSRTPSTSSPRSLTGGRSVTCRR